MHLVKFAENCFVNPIKITGLSPYLLSDGTKGTKILLDGGNEMIVHGCPIDTILKLKDSLVIKVV